MSLQALKLTKENLPTIAKSTGANPESLRLLAANRDQYVMLETMALGVKNNWTVVSEVIVRNTLKFVTPETNQFVNVILK